MTRRPRLVTILTALLGLTLAVALLAPATSQARPAVQAGGRSAEQYLDEGIQRLEQQRADDPALQSDRDQAAAAGAAAVNRAAALEQQRQQLRSALYGYAWPQPPYPGGPEARPYPWALLGAPFLPVFPNGETSFMGITPPPSDPSYGDLVRGYTTPLGFITNFDETRNYLCASRAPLFVPGQVPAGMEYCVNYWDAQQALLSWSSYLNRPLGQAPATPPSPDAAVAAIGNALNGWVQGESTLTQVRPTPIPTPVPQLTGPGVVTGVIRNAATGRAIVGATIQGPGGQVAASESGGRYTLTGLPLGRVELTASYPGYIADSARVLIPLATQPGQLDLALSQVLAPGEVRIVLVWGSTPRDLDSHLWLPTPTDPEQAIGAAGAIRGAGAEIFYLNLGNPTRPPFVGLDVDDVTCYGPETITIRRLQPGTYTFAVHNFSGEAPLGTSLARISVLAGDRVVQRFLVPVSAGLGDRWWTVFTLDGATATIAPVNTVSGAPPLPSAAGSGGGAPAAAAPGGTPAAGAPTGSATAGAPTGGAAAATGCS
jgi:uncharacterized protein YfaP (DUF2135 family)